MNNFNSFNSLVAGQSQPLISDMSTFNAGGALGESMYEAIAVVRGLAQQFQKAKQDTFAQRLLKVAEELKRIDDESDKAMAGG